MHCMKSSLYGLHLAPMKKLADNNGAELAPISVTAGMSAGRGVVSIRVVWLNLQLRMISKAFADCVHRENGDIHSLSSRHLGGAFRGGRGLLETQWIVREDSELQEARVRSGTPKS